MGEIKAGDVVEVRRADGWRRTTARSGPMRQHFGHNAHDVIAVDWPWPNTITDSGWAMLRVEDVRPAPGG